MIHMVGNSALIEQVIASGVASTVKEVRTYANCTLLAAAVEEEERERSPDQPLSQVTENSIEGCIQYLTKHELIR